MQAMFKPEVTRGLESASPCGCIKQKQTTETYFEVDSMLETAAFRCIENDGFTQEFSRNSILLITFKSSIQASEHLIIKSKCSSYLSGRKRFQRQQQKYIPVTCSHS